jgi:hypothetical protein
LAYWLTTSLAYYQFQHPEKGGQSYRNMLGQIAKNLRKSSIAGISHGPVKTGTIGLIKLLQGDFLGYCA